MRITISTILLICIFNTGLFAQFEGRVVYKVSYETSEEEKKEMLSMLPEESVLTVKDHHSLFEQKVAGGGKQAFIIDAEDGSGVLVMQFLGQGYKVEMTQSEIETLKATQKMAFTETQETKEIAGFTCNKAIAVTSGDTLEVYYAKDIITTATFPPFADIDGLPLEYELVRGGVKMKYTAASVIKASIREDEFEADPNLNSMKFEDFARSFAISE